MEQKAKKAEEAKGAKEAQGENLLRLCVSASLREIFWSKGSREQWSKGGIKGVKSEA